MQRARNRPLELALGLTLSAVLVAAVVVIWKSFRGDFAHKVGVAAELGRAGDALQQGDIVTYRNVIVGEVSAASGNTDGGAVATLKIDPKAARQIPADVTALAVPASLFGTTKIELVPPRDLSGPRLHDGALVRADRSATAADLQTALQNVYTLLTSVHPAQLDAALSALATALQGQGSRLNALISRADDYLGGLAPRLPELDGVITSLATVTARLARDAPQWLDSLANSLVVAKGILRDKRVVAELLDAGPAAAAGAQRLFDHRSVDNAVTVLQNEVPVSAALAAHPRALAETIGGFKAFADTFNGTLADGPYLNANILLTGADFTQLLPTTAGGKGDVFHAIVNPPEYTTADCPRYADASGPNCGSRTATRAESVRLLSTGTGYGGTSASVGSAREARALRAAASTLTRIPEARLPSGVIDVLLGPVLRGTPTVVQAVR